MTAYAQACRACALGLLNTAREVKRDGNTKEVIRLVNTARWFWQRYIWELTQ